MINFFILPTLLLAITNKMLINRKNSNSKLVLQCKNNIILRPNITIIIFIEKKNNDSRHNYYYLSQTRSGGKFHTFPKIIYEEVNAKILIQFDLSFPILQSEFLLGHSNFLLYLVSLIFVFVSFMALIFYHFNEVYSNYSRFLKGCAN